MIRLRLSLELDYEVFDPGCDFIFNIHAAHTNRQRVIEESLTLNQNVATQVETDPATLNRYLRLSARPGPLRVAYQARPDVEIAAHLAEVLWVSGQRDEARKILRDARKRDATNEVLVETVARLKIDL